MPLYFYYDDDEARRKSARATPRRRPHAFSSGLHAVTTAPAAMSLACASGHVPKMACDTSIQHFAENAREKAVCPASTAGSPCIARDYWSHQ